MKKSNFFLGTHVIPWLAKVKFPIFISRRQLYKRKTFPESQCEWSLDSGGFTELNMYGKWSISYKTYANEVERYKNEINGMRWASSMDWMCESFVLKKTGLSVKKHQTKTVSNFLDLKNYKPDIQFIPVIQGYSLSEYYKCVEMYYSAGIELHKYDTVGVGSVCRRENTIEIYNVMKLLFNLGIKVHGFGVKTGGLSRYAKFLKSSDSLAWSAGARYGKILLEGCVGHINCANCLRYAKRWRKKVLKLI